MKLIDNLINNIYSFTPSKLREFYELIELPERKFEKHYRKIVLGYSHSFEGFRSDKTMVIGGPCLSYTNGDYKKIILKDCIDIMMPIITSKELNLPCLLVFENEQYQNISTITSNDWNLITDILKNFANYYACEIGYNPDNLFFFNSLNPDDLDIQDNLYKIYGKFFKDDELFGLYSIDYRSDHPKKNIHQEEYLKTYKKTLITYLPQFASRVTDKGIDKIIISENVNQLRVYFYIKNICENIGCDIPSIIAHVAAPNIDGVRMDIGRNTKKLYIHDTVDKISNRLRRSKVDVIEYYSSLAGEDLHNEKIEKAISFITSMKMIYENALNKAYLNINN